MAAVAFHHAEKVYPDGSRVISDFNLQVTDGELLVLVGPSGCGKSTVLRMVAGLEEVSSGEILINGEVVNDWSPQRRNIAMVFQNYALYPHMSVRGNLEFPLRMRRLAAAEIRQRVERAAAMLNLTALLDCKPRVLSGGQRQRVAMGRAIVRDASVFLMDEPLSNLDASLRVQIRTDIAALQQSLGITTLYVTHDQVEAMTLGHRVAVMRAGVLQQVAAPRELYENPANVFVAGFIGSPGMNVVRGRLDKDDRGLVLLLGAARVPVGEGTRTRHPGLEGWCGRSMLIGMRPEALSLTEAGAGLMPATVRSAESLGHETIVYVDAALETVATDTAATARGTGDGAGPLLAAVLPGHRPFKPEEVLKLSVDPDGLYCFTPEGERI